MASRKGRGNGSERGTFAVEMAALAVGAAAAAILAAVLLAAWDPDMPSLDGLACIRFHLAHGCPR